MRTATQARTKRRPCQCWERKALEAALREAERLSDPNYARVVEAEHDYAATLSGREPDFDTQSSEPPRKSARAQDKNDVRRDSGNGKVTTPYG